MSTSISNTDNDLEPDRELGEGHHIAALGPSDSSDSGSDMAGTAGRHDDTDSTGTGERASVERNDANSNARDIDVDRIDQEIAPDEADQ